MSVSALKLSSEPVQDGVTYAQAMEIGRRFYEGEICDAAPTIAHDMRIDYETVCGVLGGRIWPGVHSLWMDRVFP